MPQIPPVSVSISFGVCSFPVERPGDAPESRIQIFPAGTFEAPNGALRGAGPWHLDEAAARALIARMAAQKKDIVIDYEHQTLLARENGREAVAAGWVSPASLRWAPEGLFAAASWTDKAKGHIASDEYRYLSPVFVYDENGVPLWIHSVALTNTPAIDGMDRVLAAAASSNPFNKVQPMPLHKDVATLLGLAEDADDAAIAAACKAVSEKLQKADEAMAAASAPDPAKFVPVTAVAKLEERLAALTAAQAERDIADLIDPALADGRLSVDLESWARDLGKKDFAALNAYIDKAKPIAALMGSQTGGRPPADHAGSALLRDAESRAKA